MKYRNKLPQTSGHVCLTDGGLETVLVFQQGINLPGFAAFTLLDREQGIEILEDYFRPYAAIAQKHQFGLLLESPTWRSSLAWGEELGYDAPSLDAINARAIELMAAVRSEHETPHSPMPISGCIGPRGDGYIPSERMTASEAARYHDRQIRVLAENEADLISALTLNYVEEAIGITRAAASHEIPVAISFTVETDGRLPGGEKLGEAIERCDSETERYAAYYMINCAHPTHFEEVLCEGGEWLDRLGGVRANASMLSHAELDESTQLDSGNPEELGKQVGRLTKLAHKMSLFGGCCGTDHRHIAQIAESLAESEAAREG